MTSKRPKFARVSALALATCSIALVALACDAKLPTSEEVNSMDVAAAEGAAQRVRFLGIADSTVSYTIDGRKASADEAHALAPEDIASVEVLKNKIDANGVDARQTGEVRILTKRAADSLVASGGILSPPGQKRVRLQSFVVKDSLTLSADSIVLTDGSPGETRVRHLRPLERKPFDGVLLLNGVRVSNSELNTIQPTEIVSVEVVKGDAARKLYADSAAANGVIRITTRSGSRKP